MSHQSYANEQTPYWLARTGVEKVSFVPQAAPPIAWLGRGIVYELVDGNLYYNGAQILTAGSTITVDAVTFTPEAANPGGADTLWIHSPDGHLRHGSHDLENDDPTVLYVSPNGRTVVAGANGAICDPVSTISDALTLWDSGGTTVLVTGGYLADPFTLPAQTVIRGDSCLSFRTIIGAVTVAGATWLPPPAFGFNQSTLCDCNLQGLIDFQATPMSSPLLSIQDSVILGGVVANDGNCDALLLIKGCAVGSLVNVVNTNMELTQCDFGVVGLAAGDLQVSHSAAANMRVVVSDIMNTPPGTFTINANSLANVLTVSLVGNMIGATINVNSVTALGGLVLVVDDLTSINWGVGAQANTTLVYVKRAEFVGYTPAVPGNWSVPPTQVADALDQLAATGSGDVSGPAGATDNAVARFDGVTGKLIQNSVITIDDSGNAQLSATAYITRPNSTSQTLGTSAGAALGVGDTGTTAIGHNALLIASGAINNTAVGVNTGESITTGGNNTIVGTGAAVNLTTGGNNIAIGSGAASSLTTASNVISIGSSAGATSDQINIGTSQTTCNIQGINSTAGDSTNWVTCTSAGALGVNFLPWSYMGFCSDVTNFVGNTQGFVSPVGGRADSAANKAQVQYRVDYNFDLKTLMGGVYSTGANTVAFQVAKNGVLVGTQLSLSSVANTFTSGAQGQAAASFAPGDLMQIQIDINAALLTTIKSLLWEVIGVRH